MLGGVSGRGKLENVEDVHGKTKAQLDRLADKALAEEPPLRLLSWSSETEALPAGIHGRSGGKPDDELWVGLCLSFTTPH